MTFLDMLDIYVSNSNVDYYYLLFAYCTLSFHSSIFLEYLVLLAFYLGSSLGFSKLSDGLVKPASQAWPMEVLLSIGKDIQSRNDNTE